MKVMCKNALVVFSIGFSFAAQAFDWPQPGGGTTEVTIPASTVAVVEETDVAALEALTKITLEANTSGIKFCNTSPLTLSAEIASSAAQNNGNPAAIEMLATTGKITFNGNVYCSGGCRNFILGNCEINKKFGSERNGSYGTFYVLPNCTADFTSTAQIVREYCQQFATYGNTGSGTFRFACTVPYGNSAGIYFGPCTIVCAEGFALNQNTTTGFNLSAGGFGNLRFDLDGRNRTLSNISGGSNTALDSNAHCYEFTSATPATNTLKSTTTRTTSLCVTGAASLDYATDGVLTLMNGVTDTSGSINLSQGGLTFAGNAQVKRATVNVSNGILKASVNTAFGKEADIVITATGILEVPEGVLVAPRSLTINGTAVDLRLKPTMTDLAKLFPNNVAGGGSVFAPCDYYVDANKGADEGRDGYTEATAFKTLAKACSVATVVGSRIIALPGVYAQGGSGSRASVPVGVTLVSRDGAEVTAIEGESGMRCVTLGDTARLEGFTLRNGNSSNGGGVNAASSSLIVGCVISNCTVSNHGGAGYSGKYLNCRVSGVSSSVGYAQGIRGGAVYGCAFYDQNDSVDSCDKVVGCTFVGNWSSRGMRAISAADDCVFRGNEKVSNSSTVYTRCVFSTAPNSGTLTDCVVTNAAGIALDTQGRPAKDSPVVDFADWLAYSNAVRAAGFSDADLAKDAFGGQRRYNGRMDAGAAEYDWRGDYAAALGKRAVVDEASGDVCLNDNGRVCLGMDGAFLCLRRDRGTGFAVTAGMSSGTVKAFVDGVQRRCVAAPGGMLSVSELPAGECAKLVYAGNDEAVLSGFASGLGLCIIVR